MNTKREFRIRQAASVILLLCLALTACAPAAEVTPTPTPTATPTPTVEPTPIPTPEPTPVPTPEPTPPYWGGEEVSAAHYWSNDGYSYTSEALGIRLKFPAAWENYFNIVEYEHIERNMRDQDGNPVEPYATTELSLEPKDFTLETVDGYIEPLATIYFAPKGMSYDSDSGAWFTLAETENGRYICYMDTMLMMWYKPGISADGAKYAIINEVQGGIMDGRWEIEVLEK